MSEEAYTLKEMVTELRGETKMQSVVLTQVNSSLAQIEKHLASLAEQVKDNTDDIDTLKTFQVRVMSAWGAGIAAVSFIITHYL